jgi:hypothetical protein
MLTQVQGTVEYNKGKGWKAVTRNKFLFDGYRLRTGANGSGRLVDQATNLVQDMGPSSVVEVNQGGVSKVSGSLSDPQPASGGLVSSISDRFKKAQRYTTVRRSVEKVKGIKLSTPRQISLAPQYSDLVWENVGPEYTYRLVIDGRGIDIPATNGDLVRQTVSGLGAGEHEYKVEVLKGGVVVLTPRRTSSLTWLGGESLAALKKGIDAIQGMSPGDDFTVARYLEDNDLLVAAMDHYRKFFQANPDDLDMYPMLIKSYHDLSLRDLEKKAAVAYSQQIQGNN